MKEQSICPILASTRLSINKANEFIKETLENYKQLEKIVEVDGNKRDTSIYYNWLEEIDN